MREAPVDQLLRAVADDLQQTKNVGERLAAAKRAGASWRQIARKTGIPTTTVRRWARPFLTPETGQQHEP